MTDFRVAHLPVWDADVAAVFPLEGEVTAIATSAAPRWPTVQDWTNDVREARRNYGRVIVQRLNELNVERGRIGITDWGKSRELGRRKEPSSTVRGSKSARRFLMLSWSMRLRCLRKFVTSKARKSLMR